jgi:hypothetical protein
MILKKGEEEEGAGMGSLCRGERKGTVGMSLLWIGKERKKGKIAQKRSFFFG